MYFKVISRTDNFRTLGFFDLLELIGGEDPIGVLSSALSDGQIDAYVQIEGDERFYCVPFEHWARKNGMPNFAEGTPSAKLFCWGSSDVPAQFRDCSILFFVDEVQKWLGPSENCPAGPDGVGHNREATDQSERGIMPESARPSDYKHEAQAHEAASLVRREKVKLSEAIRRVAVLNPAHEETSTHSAIRRAFNLMYRRDGTPIKN